MIPWRVRHGNVIEGTGDKRDCGGPSWCAICNMEMIELETLALHLQDVNNKHNIEFSTRNWARNAGGYATMWRRRAAYRLPVEYNIAKGQRDDGRGGGNRAACVLDIRRAEGAAVRATASAGVAAYVKPDSALARPQRARARAISPGGVR